MPLLRLKSLPALAACLMLAGCGAIPWSTQLKLRSFDPLTFDPAVPRAAVLITDRLRVLPGQARLRIAHWRRDSPHARSEEVFTLQEIREPAPETLEAARNDNERVLVFRLRPEDIARARRLQSEFAERKLREPDTYQAELLSDISACATAPLPVGSVPATLYLKLDAAHGYLPFLQGVDLRDLARSAGKRLDEEVRPCPPEGKRQAG